MMMAVSPFALTSEAHAGVLIRGISRISVRAPRASFQRVQTTSAVLKATNPTFKLTPTSNPELASEARAQRQYYQQMKQWYRQRLQYDRKVAQLEKKRQKQAQREAERRRRMAGHVTHGPAGTPTAALDTVATDPRAWFMNKIAGRKTPSGAAPAAPAPATRPALQLKPTEAKPATDKPAGTDRPGLELKGVQKKAEPGVWFHIKRALGLV